MIKTALPLFAIFFSLSISWGQAKKLVCALEKPSSQKETAATPCTECLEKDSNQKTQTAKLPTPATPDPVVDTFTEAQLDYFLKLFKGRTSSLDNPETLKLQIDEAKKTLELCTKIENGGGPEAEKTYLEIQNEKSQLSKQYDDPKTTAEEKIAIEKKYIALGTNSIDVLHSLALIFKTNPSQFQARKALYESNLAKYQARLKALEETSKSTSGNLNLKRQTLRELMKSRIQYLLNRPQFSDCGLTDFEIMSTLLYTGSHFRTLNAALRGGDETLLEQVGPMIQAINSGLEKLARHENTVVRTASLPKEVADQHCLGCVVEYRSFTSTSTGMKSFGDTRFVIKSKSARYIAPLSANASEEEVLFKSGTKFRVVNVKSAGGRVQEYTMEEVTDSTPSVETE